MSTTSPDSGATAPVSRVQLTTLSSNLLPPFQEMILIEPCRPAPSADTMTFPA